jgi:hypothetical protein
VRCATPPWLTAHRLRLYGLACGAVGFAMLDGTVAILVGWRSHAPRDAVFRSFPVAAWIALDGKAALVWHAAARAAPRSSRWWLRPRCLPPPLVLTCDQVLLLPIACIFREAREHGLLPCEKTGLVAACLLPGVSVGAWLAGGIGTRAPAMIRVLMLRRRRRRAA